MLVLGHNLIKMFNSNKHSNTYFCKNCKIEYVFLRPVENEWMYIPKRSGEVVKLSLTCEEQQIKNLLE